MVSPRSHVVPHLRRRARRAVLVLAIALPGALAAAPAAEAVCNPTYPAFGGLNQPADAACPPIASFTVDHTQVLPGATVHFDASGSLSDPPGAIIEYDWNFGDGTPVEVHGPGDATTSHLYPTKGGYTATLTVKDATASSTPSPTHIAVTQPPTAMLVVMPHNTIEVGQSATLNAVGSTDPDGTIVSYEWDYEGDGTYDATTSTPASSHPYPATGNFSPKVRVTDEDGATDVKSVSLNVHNPPVVSFTAGPTLVALGGTVSFNGSASSSSDPGGITAYDWDFGDGVTQPNGPAQTTHAYPTKGHYNVVLRVRDAVNNPVGVASTPITITATATPIAQLAVTPNPSNAGDSITLNAAGSNDPDGSIVRYDWDYEGDGSYDLSTTTPSVSHVYPNRGTFTPKVRVVDDYGVTNVKTANLVVNDPGAPTGATPPGGSNSDGSGPSAFAATLMGSPIQKVKLISKSGVTVLCSANRAATCTLRLEVSARDARRLGMRSRKGRPVQIGTARVTVARGRTASVRFNLNARVRRALKRISTLKVTVLGSAADATGKRVALARVVLVRR